MTDTSYVLVTIWIAALDQANHEQGEQGADDGVNDDAGGHGFAFPVFVILVIVFPSNVYRGIPLMREFMMVLRLEGLGWVMSAPRLENCVGNAENLFAHFEQSFVVQFRHVGVGPIDRREKLPNEVVAERHAVLGESVYGGNRVGVATYTLEIVILLLQHFRDIEVCLVHCAFSFVGSE
jgi:hypothetical protein